ncbi:hypothetical protein C1752_03718 [Acaryochloris thomasi RCC1774]|uniref:Uncharacterized protein n=1 Tax=Acaryochloris thomasi RCC1774 TaxID=1764569 RepID=A0A2W1JQS9_9CYAN|nr:DUF3611 family protein [Acaryochloris thomasi]PZD72464.1 hypothetical protein C1752_03718 [Acaryochloris thomasi RCC1774]
MSRMLEGGNASAGFRGLGISFRLVGWASFWIKLVLAIISGVTILFAFPFAFFRQNLTPNVPNVPGSQVAASSPSGGLGLLIIAIGIVFLSVSVFWSFRFTRFSRRFLIPGANPPTKAETLRMVKLALVTDVFGMLMAVIGGEWIVGVIIGKAISQGVVFAGLTRIVEPIELLVVQACINTMAGQFAGIASSLWLLQRTTQIRPSK